MPDDEHVHDENCQPAYVVIHNHNQRALMAAEELALSARRLIATELSIEQLSTLAELFRVIGNQGQGAAAAANYWEGMAQMSMHMHEPSAPEIQTQQEVFTHCVGVDCSNYARTPESAFDMDWSPIGKSWLCPSCATGGKY